MDDKKREDIALFRYGVIAEFFNKEFRLGEKSALLIEKANQTYDIPYSLRTSIAASTIKEWSTKYRQGSFEALKPRDRSDQGYSRVFSSELVDLIIALKKENLSRSAPTIAKELTLAGKIPPEQKVAPSTIHRLLVNQGLTEKVSPTKDRRIFEYAYPGELLQSDSLHGPKILDPQKGKKRKVYLYAFIDDATRVIPHAQFYFDEGLLSFEHAFKQALLKKGLPARLYTDNGAAYRSHHLQVVCATLGIILIHAKARVPQGKGKIERFFRSTRMQFIDNLDLEKIKGLDELNSRLWAWIEGEYHRTIHSRLNETPLDKWMRLSEHVRYLSPQIDLEEIFLHRAKRKIYNDRTFSLEGVLYEAPAHLVGKQVEVRYNPTDKSQVKVYFNGKLEQISIPANPYQNCFVKRIEDSNEILSSNPPLTIKKSGINYVELVHQNYYQNQPKKEEK